MQYTTVVGVDPDSKAHALAIYRSGILEELRLAQLMEVDAWLSEQPDLNQVLFSVEDTLAQSFVYARNVQHSKAAHARVALSVGRCQQAQEELMRLLAYRGVKYELHRPMGTNWHANISRFKTVTRWAGRSNDDTRSAAFFGWLALQLQGKERRAK